MNKPITTLFATLMLVGATQAVAASSVDLGVTGVITPSACDPTLSNGGVYDLGKIAARDLNIDQPTQLTKHSLQLAITCEGPTLLALEPRDNRPNTAYTPISTVRFGLGLIGGDKKLGYMSLELEPVVDNGTRVYPIGSTPSSTWAPTRLLSYAFLTSFAAGPTTMTPIPIQQVVADLNITPIIAPTNTLPLTEEVPIDGSMTLTMRYL